MVIVEADVRDELIKKAGSRHFEKRDVTMLSHFVDLDGLMRLCPWLKLETVLEVMKPPFQDLVQDLEEPAWHTDQMVKMVIGSISSPWEDQKPGIANILNPDEVRRYFFERGFRCATLREGASYAHSCKDEQAGPPYSVWLLSTGTAIPYRVIADSNRALLPFALQFGLGNTTLIAAMCGGRVFGDDPKNRFLLVPREPSN